VLYLATGTPGAGKTLNTIKWINEDDRFKVIRKGKGEPKLRQVYYYGIKNLDPSFGWIEMVDREAQSEFTGTDNVVSIVDPDELGPDPLLWFELPSGSVIVFDEAYNHFPVRHGAKQPPPHVKELATHRHKGFDVVLITQKVSGQLDKFIHGLVNHHQNYVRVFGTDTVMRFSWDLCQSNPNAVSAKQTAVVKTMRYDKKYFGSYHSADEHTSKPQLPWKQIIFLALGLLTLFVVSYMFYDRVYGRAGEAVSLVSPSAPPSAASSEFGGTRKRSPAVSRSPDGLTFAQLHTPEVSGIPWSSPVYRDLTAPKSWPRPAACIFRESAGSCSCYSQQGTVLNVSLDFCRMVVDKGFFDWTKADLRYGSGDMSEEVVGSLRPQNLLTHIIDMPF